jgi:hypothetical protein
MGLYKSVSTCEWYKVKETITSLRFPWKVQVLLGKDVTDDYPVETIKAYHEA